MTPEADDKPMVIGWPKNIGQITGLINQAPTKYVKIGIPELLIRQGLQSFLKGIFSPAIIRNEPFIGRDKNVPPIVRGEIIICTDRRVF